MRVLIVAAEAPLPPITGFRLVVDTLLEHLPARHDVRLVALRMPDQQEGRLSVPATIVPWPSLSRRDDLRDLVRATWTGRPLRPDRLASVLGPHVRAEIERSAPDVVHVVSERLAALSRWLDDVPTVLTPLDAWHRNVVADARTSTWVRRWLLRGEVERVRRYEATEYVRFDKVTVVSQEDAQALRELEPRLPLEVVPNGVDLEHYAPRPAIPRDRHRITFHGVMRYPPNVTAARYLVEEILPLVHEEVPAAVVTLVGRDPSAQVQALAGERVQVTGEVEDVVPWLARSRVYACPVRSGTGIKNKLLEAMACATPAVATPLALQGMHPQPGRDVLVGEDRRQVADAIVELLRDDDRAETVGRSGRAYVEQHHSWDTAVAAYERCYEEVVG